METGRRPSIQEVAGRVASVIGRGVAIGALAGSSFLPGTREARAQDVPASPVEDPSGAPSIPENVASITGLTEGPPPPEGLEPPAEEAPDVAPTEGDGLTGEVVTQPPEEVPQQTDEPQTEKIEPYLSEIDLLQWKSWNGFGEDVQRFQYSTVNINGEPVNREGLIVRTSPGSSETSYPSGREAVTAPHGADFQVKMEMENGRGAIVLYGGSNRPFEDGSEPISIRVWCESDGSISVLRYDPNKTFPEIYKTLAALGAPSTNEFIIRLLADEEGNGRLMVIDSLTDQPMQGRLIELGTFYPPFLNNEQRNIPIALYPQGHSATMRIYNLEAFALSSSFASQIITSIQ